MSLTATRPGQVEPADVERWLADLRLVPDARTDRDGVTAWDLELDGRRRFDIPVTLILDPNLALIVWVHFAPPIGDGLRKSYRTLLRWNDDFPFAKFSLAEDGRPILMAEIAIGSLDADLLGLTLTRLLLICDRLLEASAEWLWIGGRIPDRSDRRTRKAALFERFGDRLTELLGS
ncbi:MAG TPA: YbjN domain-containing protein [Candidatus Limnocylindrales bacterium]|nr:YbjN domain-containing protein [Candidatus Limnocylindrales bacterium]